MAEAAEQLPMGEGQIPARMVPEELRVVRHNVRNIQSAVNGWGDMVQAIGSKADAAAAKADAASAKSEQAQAAVSELDAAIFGGRPGRPGALSTLTETVDRNAKEQREAIESLARSQKTATAQNWAIIIGMLGVVATMLLIFLTHRP